jgi:hypothetical protein
MIGGDSCGQPELAGARAPSKAPIPNQFRAGWSSSLESLCMRNEIKAEILHIAACLEDGEAHVEHRILKGQTICHGGRQSMQTSWAELAIGARIKTKTNNNTSKTRLRICQPVFFASGLYRRPSE